MMLSRSWYDGGEMLEGLDDQSTLGNGDRFDHKEKDQE
jgi:hypothetical protein